MTQEELRTLLLEYDVPLERWGTGRAKTLEHLLAELNAGEGALAPAGGGLQRTLSSSLLLVYYQHGPTTYLLREDRQEFADGRVRRRRFDASLGEKMRRGEEPRAAAYRALAEELGITERIALKADAPYTVGPQRSASFPGLSNVLVMYPFETHLPPHLYRPGGYKERQADKTSYFIWMPA
jgi:hypothetical protein